LEIRYLPLDPLFVEFLFSALKRNVYLQELILTDDALAYCSVNTFGELKEALMQNTLCGLSLLDFSRNQKDIDENEDLHKVIIEGIRHQKKEQDYLQLEDEEGAR
jgi:hypothetical protein